MGRITEPNASDTLEAAQVSLKTQLGDSEAFPVLVQQTKFIARLSQGKWSTAYVGWRDPQKKLKDACAQRKHFGN